MGARLSWRHGRGSPDPGRLSRGLTPDPGGSISAPMKGHARHLMTAHVLAVKPATTLVEIARVLVTARHGGVPVIDDEDRVIGFVSESDLLDAALRGDPEEKTAYDLMSQPVLVVDEFTPIEEVMSLLKDGKVRHLPVVRAE